ncbi:hypothetical protein A2572_03220 [Candidatus Collierbacteria bacterium RIFOXYD1_FULL_40_9]|uniref:CBS domain-containing protein n=1 Tax=Candidatus Collierbacteria bacterium RIFOXYD1_FULL_40_9 TaxID=1817731 RepID=A0A1F5FX05_9BACT|nr:MAG: hypothetical protein A2572_03220 [Candidatus Collierbacteria bacterium RIFOXYD1_FULL_40_9]
MLRIAHSVSEKVHTVNHSTSVEEAAKKIAEKRIGALPVLKDGHLVGIISERDIATKLVAQGLNPKNTKVSQIMTPNPTIVFPSYDLEVCLDLMERGHFRHLPVIDDYKLIGMISIRDILVALHKEKDDLLIHFENYIFANR